MDSSHLDLRRTTSAPSGTYSNLDYWLLQEVIAARAGADFEQVLQSRLLTPLGLRSTAATWSPELQARAAAGHDAALQPAPTFASMPVFNLMPAAGGMVSTANDLLKFLGMVMGYQDTKLAPSIARAAADTQTSGRPASRRSAGGHWRRRGCDRLPRWRQFRVFAARWPGSRSVASVWSCFRIRRRTCGRHCTPPAATSVPLEQPKRARHTEITLDAAILDRYVGPL